MLESLVQQNHITRRLGESSIFDTLEPTQMLIVSCLFSFKLARGLGESVTFEKNVHGA